MTWIHSVISLSIFQKHLSF